MNERTRFTVWIAEDAPLMAKSLSAFLEGHGLSVVLTDDPAVARHWLLNPEGPIVLDGSVWRETGIPLEELPEQAILFTGDDDLAAQARSAGRRAFVKATVLGWNGLKAALNLAAPAPAER